MKNLMLGMVGCLLLVYLAAISMSIYTITWHRKELSCCLSAVMKQTMQACYRPGIWSAEGEPACSDTAAEKMLREELNRRVQEPEELQLTVYVCDMRKGILSLEAEEDVALPSGNTRRIQVRRTLIVDREDW